MQSIMKFSTMDEALVRANASEYGLAAGAPPPPPLPPPRDLGAGAYVLALGGEVVEAMPATVLSAVAVA